VIEGVMRQVGTAKQIKSHPADETVRAFLEDMPQ
jgi:ABC-type proline/glycine betaine transport system ATPase subunit